MKVGIFPFIPAKETGGSYKLQITYIETIFQQQDKWGDHQYFVITSFDSFASIIDHVPEQFIIDLTSYFKQFQEQLPIKTKLTYKLGSILHSFLNANYIQTDSKFKFGFPVSVLEELYYNFLREQNIDFIWFTFPFFCPVKRFPFAISVWDLAHLQLPYFKEFNDSNDWKFRENFLSETIKRASLVFTGNQQGKQDLLTHYPIKEDKIKTLPFPFSPANTKSLTPKDSAQKYFIYPAQFWQHKNHATIIDAMVILSEKTRDYRVHFCGSDRGNKEYIQNYSIQCGVEDLCVFHDFVEDTELTELISNAEAMIYATCLGPNNLPPLEALSLDCPVICSEFPGAREQYVNTVCYFETYSSNELANRMESMLLRKEETLFNLDSPSSLLEAYSSNNVLECFFDHINEFEKIKKLGPC